MKLARLYAGTVLPRPNDLHESVTAESLPPGGVIRLTSNHGVSWYIKNLHHEAIPPQRLESMRRTFERMPKVLQEVSRGIIYNPRAGTYAKPGVAIVIGDKVGDSLGRYLHEAGHNLQAERTTGSDWELVRASEYPHGWSSHTRMGTEDFAESVKLYVLNYVPITVSGHGKQDYVAVFPKRAAMLGRLIHGEKLK